MDFKLLYLFNPNQNQVVSPKKHLDYLVTDNPKLKLATLGACGGFLRSSVRSATSGIAKVCRRSSPAALERYTVGRHSRSPLSTTTSCQLQCLGLQSHIQ